MRKVKGAYYNEIDPFAAQWLRNLISRKCIAAGDVDERPIQQVTKEDVQSYAQCHFFAGLGGWSYALRLAKWPDDRPVWTGSCPCQPFSAAGRKRGTEDERHLWPVWRELIAQCKPAVVFGEQVASSPGRRWLASVRADLESLAYAVGAADLCAAGVGAPHIRQRLWFVAEWLAHTDSQGRESRRLEQNAKRTSAIIKPGRGPWADVEWLACADEKKRPIESGIEPLADGIPGRMGRLRAYGNAIVPQVAAEFIAAWMET